MTINLIKRPLLVALFCLLAFPVSPFSKEFRGRGDFEFYLDEAVFHRPGIDPIQEVYIRVSNSELKYKSSGDGFVAKLNFSIFIKDKNGDNLIEDAFAMDFFENTEEKTKSPLQFQTIIKKYNLPPGRHELYCSIRDLQSPKVTVIDMARGKHKTATVSQVPLDIPPYDPQMVSVSDPMFLFRVDNGGDMPVYHPNPPRLYGLYKDSLEVYMELYLPDSLGGNDKLRFESILLDEKGEIVKKSGIPLEERGKHSNGDVQGSRGQLLIYPLLLREDLTIFDAGSYSLYVNIKLEEQLISRFRCGRFSVAWDLMTWETPRRAYLAEARFLLGDEGFKEFLVKSIGEREKMLEALWEALDPLPHTATNEAYEKFLERLEYVNTHYSDYQQGIFTDRGLIYLKYGEPDEVVAEVVPLNRESVSDALEKIENRYHPVSYSTHGVRGDYRGPTKDVIVDPRRIGVIGEGGNVAFPYELWIYSSSGDPILKRDRVMETDIGLRFIFIDREGYGRYKLESSSSMTDK